AEGAAGGGGRGQLPPLLPPRLIPLVHSLTLSRPFSFGPLPRAGRFSSLEHEPRRTRPRIHPVAEPFLNFIAGRWVPARSGRTFPNLCPANGETIGEFPASEAADVADAVAAAAAAKRGWHLAPARKRAEILFRVGALIAERKEELARAATREMGKILIETRGDVQEGVDMAFLAAGEGRRMYGVTTPSEMPNKWAMSVRVPVGIAGVITAWNFPFAVPTWKIFPALVSGNTVVFKPSEESPETAVNLVKLLEEAGL